jgi:hypothetical protein
MLRHCLTSLPFLLASAAAVGFAPPRQAEAAEQRVSGPYTHDNLTIFLVHGASSQGPVPLTLDEALEKGNVKVHETGTVGELEIENVGDEEVFVHAGDIVKGGQQDRVVTASLIMKAKSGRLPLAVFCVEAGRWAARGDEDKATFASAKEMLPTREAKLAMRSPYTVAAVRPAAPSVSEEAANAISQAIERESARTEAYARQQADDAGRQANIQERSPPSPQSEVWRSVSNIQAALTGNLGAKVTADESETSLQLALESTKLAEAQKAYIDALKSAGEKEPDVVGYVFSVNGKINSGDIYASNALFRKLWPKLLKAAATEAIGAEKALPKALDPTAAAVNEFLVAPAAAKPTERPSINGQTLETREADSALDFATKSASGDIIHRNVLARH